LSRKVLRNETSDDEIASVMSAQHWMLDAMGVYQHHDAVTGTAKQHVADNYVEKLSDAMAINNAAYTTEMMDILNKTAGIDALSLSTCIGGMNGTVTDCPIANHTETKEIIMVIHNPAAQNFSDLVRVQLPSASYTAQIWSHDTKEFIDVYFDILEQVHFNQTGYPTMPDYDMYFKYALLPNQVGFVRLNKTDMGCKVAPPKASSNSEVSLTFNKAESTRDLHFTFNNSATGILQNFTFDLNYYAADQGDDAYPDNSNCAEGAYLLKPERYERYQYDYSRLDSEEYHADLPHVQQWTFRFVSRLSEQYAIVKVKFFPDTSELVQFDVELNGIPVMKDQQGKDVTVNWIFDNFEAN